MTFRSESEGLLRAGFWRRLAAFVIDAACVLLPLQILVAVLFALTGGYIQSNFGVTRTNCTSLSALPAGLQTQITNPTHVQDCRTSLLGFDTSRVLVVSRVESGEVSTTTVSESFWLDAEGQLAVQAGYNVTWGALLALLAYFVVLEAIYGRTIGKTAMRIRAIRVASPEPRGVGWGRALARRFAWQIGGIPFILTQIPIVMAGNNLEAIASILNSPAYSVAAIVSAIIMAAWLAWLAISMARKRDPVYDRIAGTAVVRASP
nr:RDD family protein [Mesorhizobium sp.]